MNTSQPPKRSRTSRSMYVTAGLAVAAVLYVLFVFLPTQRSINKLRQEIHDQQEHILQASRLKLAVEQSRTKLRSVDTFAQRNSERLPTTKADLLRTYGKITEQAKLAGVVVRSFDPRGTVDLASLQQAQLEMSLEGTFPQIMDFLVRVEGLSNIIWLPNISLGKVEGTEATLSAEMSLTIFGDLADQAD